MNIIALGLLYNNNKTCKPHMCIRIQYINCRVIYNKNNNNIVSQRISSCFNTLSKLIKQLLYKKCE